MKDRPIGVFDSGIGGLTVVKEIIRELPNEYLIYLGDTARVPYGTRGREVITKFALELAKFLLQEKPKALVVACNTISATCLSAIEAISPVPVIGVIDSTIREAIKSTKTKSIGVIGTRATIASKIYEEKIRSIDPKVAVTSKACPLFVPLAEEGYSTHKASYQIATEYLSDMNKQNIDALILGCTHYPLLRPVIQKSVGRDILLIDSAKPTAHELKNLLEKKNLLRSKQEVTYKFFVTDAPDRTKQIAKIFYGNTFPGNIQHVDI